MMSVCDKLNWMENGWMESGLSGCEEWMWRVDVESGCGKWICMEGGAVPDV